MTDLPAGRELDAHAEHLHHMTDGHFHDGCRYCVERRVTGGTGLDGFCRCHDIPARYCPERQNIGWRDEPAPEAMHHSALTPTVQPHTDAPAIGTEHGDH